MAIFQTSERGQKCPKRGVASYGEKGVGSGRIVCMSRPVILCQKATFAAMDKHVVSLRPINFH